MRFMTLKNVDYIVKRYPELRSDIFVTLDT